VTTSRSYSLDPKRVVHETIDGESIVIDLAGGNYYSLAGSGSAIWTMLAAGCDVDYVVAELGRIYDGDPDEIRQAVDTIAGRLVSEGLLTPSDRTAALAAENDVGHEPHTAGRGPFEPPTFETYTDMQYFLLLDPIHDVDAAGWPHERRAATGDGSA
jgi:hypothetical protein